MSFFEACYVPDTEVGTWLVSLRVIEIFQHPFPKKIERGLCPQKEVTVPW